MVLSNQSDMKAALEACAREPIHVPGAIQPFGVLVVLDTGLERIVQVSANAGDFLGDAPEQLLAKSPTSVLGNEIIDRLRTWLACPEVTDDAWVFECEVDTGPKCNCRVQIAGWSVDRCVILELEPVEEPGPRSEWLARINAALHEIETAEDENLVLDSIVDTVRDFTGHDRVMAYRFDAEWNGIVVAESRRQGVDSYLGLRFPASDIPPQARAMYASNPLRIIPDVDAAPAPLIPAETPLQNGPLDLGRSLLRAVSPVHLHYLRNMGVAASLSIRIRREGELWGLIACHRETPCRISPEARAAAVTVVSGGSNRLFTLIAEAEQRFRQRVQQLRQKMIGFADSNGDVHANCEHHTTELLSLFAATGFVLVQDDRLARLGRSPGKRALQKIVDNLGRSASAEPWFTNRVTEIPAEVSTETAAGLLAVPLDLRIGVEWMLIFRPEQAETVAWAGNPNKPVTESADGPRIEPRESFASWREAKKGHAADWTILDVEAAREIAHELAIIASASDIHALNERLQNEQHALAKANRELERLAETDSMTGIWNRYRMEQAIGEELQRAERYGEVFSLILIDIDRFKKVNDEHGHIAGDATLRRMVEVVGKIMRETDRFARWGGEEFVVLATQTDEAGALELANRMREAVEAADMPNDVGTVTISLGVAEWCPGATLDTLFQQTDEGLYMAKEQGRNRVCSTATTVGTEK